MKTDVTPAPRFRFSEAERAWRTRSFWTAGAAAAATVLLSQQAWTSGDGLPTASGPFRFSGLGPGARVGLLAAIMIAALVAAYTRPRQVSRLVGGLGVTACQAVSLLWVHDAVRAHTRFGELTVSFWLTAIAVGLQFAAVAVAAAVTHRARTRHDLAFWRAHYAASAR